jgi:hypothetical protein
LDEAARNSSSECVGVEGAVLVPLLLLLWLLVIEGVGLMEREREVETVDIDAFDAEGGRGKPKLALPSEKVRQNESAEGGQRGSSSSKSEGPKVALLALGGCGAGRGGEDAMKMASSRVISSRAAERRRLRRRSSAAASALRREATPNMSSSSASVSSAIYLESVSGSDKSECLPGRT